MQFNQILLALCCIAAMSGGQLLFKQASNNLAIHANWFAMEVLTKLGIAMAVYGIATILWVQLLRGVELNKAYAFMALSFVIVPICSYFIFNEPITKGFILGMSFIVLGVFIVSRYS